jgi:hypothetical protein
MKCTVQKAKSPVKNILSGSVEQRDLILALKVNQLFPIFSYFVGSQKLRMFYKIKYDIAGRTAW